MVNKTKMTFQEWVARSKESLEALLQQSKEEQNKKISYSEIKSLVTHLTSSDIKNRPKEAVFKRVNAYCLNEFNEGKGFTKLQVLKIKSSETFPKTFEKKFLEGFNKWETNNLG